jgi:uncharacterized protein
VIEPQHVPSSDARTWAMASHLAALALFTSIPFGNVFGPLIVYLIKKDQDPFVAEQGKESLNFQLTVTLMGIIVFICYMASFFAMFLGPRNAWPLPIVVIPLFLALLIFNVACVAFAAVRSYNGEHFRYPLIIHFLR